jgi:hypothetical protein
MSGRGRPDSISPFGTSSGGYVTGTVSMLERTPALPAVTQNEVPPRIDLMFGLEIGMKLRMKRGGSRVTIPRSGR